MMKKLSLGLFGLLAMIFVAACQPQVIEVEKEVTREIEVTVETETVIEVETEVTRIVEVEVPVTMVDVPGFETWEEVLAAAEGTTVNWHMWGGSDVINSNVDSDIGERVEELYGVTLNRVPLVDTADAVNKILDENAAGVDEGTIDLIWINGENFRTLSEADLLYGNWSEGIPNARFVNWEDPALAFDFGYPVEGQESPWGAAQFVFEYNTALVGDTPPTTFEDLETWAADNPGLFTYPAVPDFVGSVFIRHLFYWAAGGPEPFLGEFDQAVYDEYAPIVWDYLNGIEPNLWRAGETYPDSSQMIDLLANQEVAFSMDYDPARASTNINEGIYPETIRTFVMDTGTISNNNFVTIPGNAPNPAGAMVVANFMLSEEFQLVMTDPNGWGWLSPINPANYSDDFQAAVANFERGPATLSPEELAANALPEPPADWVTAMEAGWIENVLEN